MLGNERNSPPCTTVSILVQQKVKLSLLFFLTFILLQNIFSVNVWADSFFFTEDILFSETTSPIKVQLTDAILRQRTVQINIGNLEEKQTTKGASSQQQTKPPHLPVITLNLFDDVVVQARHDGNYTNSSGSVTWIGEVDNPPHSTAIFVINNKSLHGIVELPTIGTFSIRPTPDGPHTIEQISDDATLSGEDDTRIPQFS